jgi:hypothetical protein
MYLWNSAAVLKMFPQHGFESEIFENFKTLLEFENFPEIPRKI